MEITRNKTSNIRNKDVVELISIFTTANMLQFLFAQNKCFEAIEESMCADNIFEIWQFAEAFHFKELLVKTRYIALTEFDDVRKSTSFLSLHPKWLFRYLCNLNLYCIREMDVFEAGMFWLSNNFVDDNVRESVIFTLLTCLDFNELSIENINKIKADINIEKIPILTYVLQHTIGIKSSSASHSVPDSIIKRVEILLKSKRRIKDGYPTFIEHDSTKTKSGGRYSQLG